MLENDVWKFLGHRICWIHISKTGGKNDIEALNRILADNAFRIRTFRHILDIFRLDFIAEILLQGKPATFVLIRPTEVPRWADIDECYF